MGDRLASAYAASPLIFWLWGSVLVYVLSTNLLWLGRNLNLWRSPYRRWLVQAGRLLFYLGIPYLVLGGWPRQPYQGLLSLGDLGIVGLDERWTVSRWLQAAGIGVGWGLFALLILALAWAGANRRGGGSRLRFSPRPWWAVLVDVLYLEVHWAFYRGALAVALDDVYVGVFAGLGFVYLEWGLNPFWRQGWREKGQAAALWLRAALALVIALLFLLTHNFWICLAVHCLLEFAFWQLGSARVPSPETGSLETP